MPPRSDRPVQAKLRCKHHRRYQGRFTPLASLARFVTAGSRHAAAGLLLALATLLVITPAQGNAQSATYRVTFEGKFTASTLASGVSVPSGDHFTTLIGAVHNGSVTFWSSGGMASADVEAVAELGTTDAFKSEINANMNVDTVFEQSIASGGTATATVDIVVTTAHPLVTLLTMVAPSPDWFVGVSGLSLLDEQGDWLASRTVNLYPWDAGTEEGTEFSLSNPATSPQGVITSLRGMGKFSNEAIATLTFTRRSVNTAPSFTSATSFEVDENQTAAGTVVAADHDSGDEVAYTITGGGDASEFEIGETTGVLTFARPPNYESPADVASMDPLNDAENNEHIVTVTATGGTADRALTAEQTITVTVRNVEEAGTVSFSQVGAAIRAKLSDPDGGVNGASWQWARSLDRSTGWVNISSATSAVYTPSSDDQEKYLRATVSYDDGHGSGKQAQGVSTYEITPPKLLVSTLVSGLTIPWDLAFTPDGTMLFTERSGVLSSRLTDGTVQTVTAEFGDVFSSGENGLMGIVVDPDFSSNRRFYTCQAHTGPEIQVIAWTINAAYTTTTRVADPLVGGMPASSFRHGGCRLRFGPQGYLWIATGDAASGTVPQDLTSLGGKVLRVDASTGAGAPANPFASSPLIYTYGHRNPQGLALRPGTSQMWSVEHGPSVDDEINLLVAGRNYGWDPLPGYNESVSMTDLMKFPGAVEAKWSSGSPTLATSGGIFLEGDQWGVWEGRLALATLQDSKLRLFEFTPEGAFVSQVVVPELNGAFGRLRTPMMGPDGALYVTTSNGGGVDRILRIVKDEAVPVTLKLTPEAIGENGGVSTVTVSLERESNVVTTVTVSATAVSPAVSGDFSLSSNKTLTIGVGQSASTGTVTITANNNGVDAPNKTVMVTGTATNSEGLTGPSDVTLTIRDDDATPVITTAALILVAENETVVATLQATDEDDRTEDLVWDITGGVDQSEFTLTTGGELAFKAAKDYENPDDSDGDRDYAVRVRVSDGANPVEADFVVRLQDVDDTAPTVSKLEITSDPGTDRTYAAENEIRVTVTFSETVVVTRTPRMRLRVGSRNRTAGYLRGSGAAALVFSYEVALGDEDTDGVSIAAGRIDLNGGTIKDEADNDAVLDHEAVAPQAGHKVDGVRPAFLSAAVNAAALTLTYGEALDEGSRPAPGDFTVQVDGSGRSVSGVSVSGRVVTLTLASVVAHDETVTVSYSPGANPIRDVPGNDAEALSRKAVTNETPDTTSPTVSSVEIPSTPPDNRDTYAIGDVIEVTVTFSETVVVTRTPRMRLRVGSRNRTAGYLRGSGAAALVFSYEVALGDEDTDGVSIAAGRIGRRGGTIKDEADNDAVLDHEAVAPQAGHKVDGVRPAFLSAAVDGSSLTLTYGEALDGGSRPGTGDFTVEVGGTGRSVSAVSVSGSVVTLTLDPAVEHGDTGIRVNYSPGTRPIRDAVGNDALALSNRSVTNTTGAPPSVTLQLMPTSISENGRSATVTARLSHTSGETTTVTVSATAVTPAVSGDFTLSMNKTLTIEAAQAASTGTVTITANNNGVDAPNKTVMVMGTASNSEGVTGPSDETLTITDDDATPVITTAALILVAENETVVATLLATDEDDRTEDLEWEITGGNDRSQFTLPGGARLAFTAAKDYEEPDDSNGDGDYEVTVQVSDGFNAVEVEFTVRLQDVDDTAPTVSRVAITSDPGTDRTYAVDDEIQVTVTFSETVEVTGTPQLRLELGGGRRTADYEGGSGTAALVFAYKVADGESDTDGMGIEAASLSGGTIRDEARNNAELDHDGLAADSGHKVDGVRPRLAASGGAVVDGTRLTLTYDEALDGGSRPVSGDFTVSGGDRARAVTGVRVNGSAVELTLDVGAEHGEAGIQVSYTPGANPIQDVPGNDAEALSREPVTNDTPDTTSPTVSSLAITSNPGGDQIYAAEDEIEVTVTFSETVVVTRTPRMRLRVGSRNRTAGYLRGSGAAALVFSYEVALGDEDTDGVSIAAGRIDRNGGTIKDEADNDAVLDHEAVAPQAGHKVDGVRPAFLSAAVDGSSLTLTYGEALDGGSRPAPGDFTVEVGGTGRSVSAVSVSGSVVTLTLDPAVEHGDTGIRVNYSPGTRPIRDAVGNDALALSNRSVTNTTGAPNTAPEITSPGSFDVPENQALVRRLAARDDDPGDEVTGWEIVGGADRFQFSVARDTGELSFQTAPDFEAPGDNEYEVRVEVRSGTGARELEAEQTFTVRVTDEREPPGIPEAPTFSGETAESMTVNWSEPENTGPPITDYDVQYQEGGGGGFTDAQHEGPGLALTLSDLKAGTVYEVQVRARNDEGMSDWSESGEGMTVTPLTVQMMPSPPPPVEAPLTMRFSFSEEVRGFTRTDITTQQEPACTDSANNPISCNPTIAALQTTDNRIFTTTVTPRTERVAHNYTLTLTVPAGRVTSAAGNKPNEEAMLEVRVAPPGVTVPISSLGRTASPGNGQVTLRWNTPQNTGGSAIIRYEYRWAESGAEFGDWVSVGPAERAATVPNLTNGREYVFEVRGVNALGYGPVETASATPESGGGGGGGGGGGLPQPPRPPANNRPMADAGPDQTGVREGALVTLDGSGSSDPDDDPLKYRWNQYRGERVALSSRDVVNPTFTAPQELTADVVLSFRLLVTDPSGRFDSDTVTVTVDPEAEPPPTEDRIYYFPHLAVGASWQTTITYINYSREEVTCQTDFISDHGSPLMVSFAELGMVDSRTDVLPPGGSVHQETDVALSAPLAPGWARATCTGLVQASLLFRWYNSEGMPVAEAGVNAATVPATRFVTFAEQGEGKNGTGVAYANPSDTAALVTFTARDADGEVLASEDLMLPPNWHGAQNMPTLFDLSSFTGSLEITSTEPIVSLSLNFEAASGFSSLPPGELDAAAQGSTTYYFPHLAVGASWQTTITYINYSREEVTCQTDFISDHGSPLMVSFAELGMVDSRTDVLPPGGSVHQETDVELSAPLAPGWARANCSGPVQASLLFRWYNSEGMPVAEAGVNAATVPATRFVTFAEQGEGKNGTGVAYANPSDTAALVTFTVRDADGEVLASEDLMLPPNWHGAQNMPTLFDLSSFTGSLEITSTEPIVSLSLNFEAAPVFSSLPPGELDASAQ